MPTGMALSRWTSACATELWPAPRVESARPRRPVGRKAHPAHGVGGLLDRLQAGIITPSAPEIEDPADAQAGAFLDADEGRSLGVVWRA